MKKQIRKCVITVVMLIIATAMCAAAGDDACDPATALRAMREDPALAEQAMSLTVKALVLRLDCKLDAGLLKEVLNDPESAEMLLMEKAPGCADKIQAVHTSNTEKSREILKSVVVDVVGYILTQRGCPEQREAVEALVDRELEMRVLQNNYLNCVVALHRIKTAERMYNSEHNEYTDNIITLAALLAAGETRDAETAEAEIGAACCAAADCDPENESERWNGDFGIDQDENGGFAIFGYPIGGPDCLIEVTLEGDDPATFEDCYAESQNDKREDNAEDEEISE